MSTTLMPRPARPRLQGPLRAFGDYLRRARLAKRLGLRACAEQVGLAPGHLSNIENGRVGAPADEVLVKLAEVLELPLGTLRCRAGRLAAPDLHRFWQSPLIPSLLMSATGWTQDEAALFQAILVASLTDSTA
jgi:transcriptional regulator with XRE-family HTH domain